MADTDKNPKQTDTLPFTSGISLRKIINMLPQCVFWKDTSLVYQGCNMRFARIAGLKHPDDIIGLTDFDLPWTRKQADFYRLCDDRVMKNNRAEYDILETQLQSDGTQAWVITNKIPIHNEANEVIGIIGSYDDVTKLVISEERLKHYEVMTATVDDMLAIIDHDCRYLAVNDAFCAAYAKSREDLLGTDVRDNVGRDFFDTALKGYIDRAFSGEVVHFEGWRTFHGSGKKYVSYTYYPVFSDTEQITGLVCKIRDSTEHKRLEQQLQQAQKMEAIGRLAGGIAHDFNNILSIINGYSDLCLYEMEHDDPYRRKVEQINEAGNRAARLTQQLLAFSKRQIIQPERLNLAAEIMTLQHMLERLLGEGIVIHTELSKNIWPVNMDRSQFEQVMLNLAINARDAMPDGGTLQIELVNKTIESERQLEQYSLPAGDYVLLTISDNGIGIPQETQTRIFEPFFTTKSKDIGTGLGLSTVYGIMKQNNGFISVDSTVNSGTQFTLLIPRCPETAEMSTPYPAAEPNGLIAGRGTILLAEDDHAVRKMCADILNDLGYGVIEAVNGRDAVESARRLHGRIDLLLTDVVMPEMSGPEAAAALKKQLPGLPVLFMSGYTEDGIVRHSVLKKNIHFLQKPVTPKSLSQAVHRCLQGAATDTQNKTHP